MQRKMNKRKAAASCWAALACLVVPMFASYFFDDMFSSLSQLFRNPELLELGWDSADYGFYAGGYSFLCVWGGLIVCGMLLDKWGVRVTGSIFVGMMTAGAALVTFAITSGMAPKTSLTVAYAGCMLFGLGSEIAGVGVTRSIAKWFKGRNMAFAMGLQLAIARLGTALALILSPMLVKAKAEGEIYTLLETAKPAFFGLALLLLGTVLWAVFVMMDARFDAQNGLTDRKERKEEDEFKFSDIIKVMSTKHFIMSALLCVFFYCSIISFKKFPHLLDSEYGNAAGADCRGLHIQEHGIGKACGSPFRVCVPGSLCAGNSCVPALRKVFGQESGSGAGQG